MTDALPRCEPDLGEGFVWLEDGRALPIANMLDICGEMTDDPREAVLIVAGSDDDKWLVIAVNGYQPVTRQ